MTIQLSCIGGRQKNDRIDMFQQAGMSVVTVMLLIQLSASKQKKKQKITGNEKKQQTEEEKNIKQKSDKIDMFQQAGMSVVTVMLLIQLSSNKQKINRKQK